MDKVLGKSGNEVTSTSDVVLVDGGGPGPVTAEDGETRQRKWSAVDDGDYRQTTMFTMGGRVMAGRVEAAGSVAVAGG